MRRVENPMPRFSPTLLCVALLLGPTWIAAADRPSAKESPVRDAVPQLISKGPRWKTIPELQRFAAEGDPLACLEYAERLLNGDGVPPDATQAREYFSRAAAAGSGEAFFRLGKLHHDGLGGPRDYGRALENYGAAARAGIPEAQHNIGAMLVSARGVRRDYVEGLAWLIVATKNGAVSDSEQRTRERLAKRPADIARAEERAKEILAALPNPRLAEIATPRFTLAGTSNVPPPPNPAAAPKLPSSVTAPPKAAPKKVPVDLGPGIQAPKPELDLPKN